MDKVILTMSAATADLILETLEADARSKAFDQSLRAELSEALADITRLDETPVVYVDHHDGYADVYGTPGAEDVVRVATVVETDVQDGHALTRRWIHRDHQYAARVFFETLEQPPEHYPISFEDLPIVSQS